MSSGAAAGSSTEAAGVDKTASSASAGQRVRDVLSQHGELLVFAVSFVVAVLALSGTILSYPLCKECGSFLGLFWTLTSVSIIAAIVTGLNYVSSVHGRVSIWQQGVAKPVAKAATVRSSVRWSLRACYVLVVMIGIMNIVLFSLFANLSATTPSVKDGTIIAAGLAAPARIERDEFGTLHIHAESRHDVFFAQGFAVAQERLWQLEFNRRAGFGRLSELFGEATLEADQFLRDVGFGRAAAGGLYWLEPEIRSALQAYAEGINAYVASDAYRAPLEFRLFGVEWETWTEAHSYVVVKLMSFDLSTNVRSEAVRWNLLMKDGLSRDDIYTLYGEYPQDVGTILQRVDEPWNDTYTTAPASHHNQVPAARHAAGDDGNDDEPAVVPPRTGSLPDWQGYMQRASAMARAGSNEWKASKLGANQFNPLADLGIGGADISDGFHSNNWVVSGQHTDTKMPYLLNDPHLGASAPMIWTFGHLHCPEFEAQGVMLSGLPWIVIGTNSYVAWGVTNNGFDIQDLFIMEPGAAPGTYVHNGTEHAYTEVVEEILVAGRDEPLQHVVRFSLYGPVMTQWYSDFDGGPDLSLKWLTVTADSHYDSTMSTFFRLNEQVRNFEDFRNAASYWSNIAGQSIVFADLSGDIGFTAPASVPVRRHHDGAFPVPGNGTYDWVDFIPYKFMPAVYNPSDGFVVTANNRAHPLNTTSPFPHLVSDMDVAPGLRYQSIRDGLESLIAATASNVTAADMVTLQHDRRDYLWKTALRDAVSTMTGLPGDWKSRMLAWDGVMDADSVEATVSGELYMRITRDLVAPDLPDVGVWKHLMFLRPLFGDSAGSPAHPVCTDRGFASCHAFLEASLKKAIDNVQVNGTLPWGEAMRTQMRHGILGFTPLGCMFNRHVGRGGSPSTANVAPIKEAAPGSANVYENTHVPSVRLLMNLADLRNGNQWMMPMGVSGSPYDRYYDHFNEKWANDVMIPMQMDDYVTEHTLYLEP